MFVISSTKKNRDYGPPVGRYTAESKEIAYAEEYADGEAFRVNYTLIDEDGQKFDYTELFHYTDKNERTRQYFEYLEENGVDYREDGLPEVVGLREEVVLKKRVGYSRPVIVERTFVGVTENAISGQ